MITVEIIWCDDSSEEIKIIDVPKEGILGTIYLQTEKDARIINKDKIRQLIVHTDGT